MQRMLQGIATTAGLWLFPALSFAQDISATWQGTVHSNSQDQRLGMQIEKIDAGAYRRFVQHR